MAMLEFRIATLESVMTNKTKEKMAADVFPACQEMCAGLDLPNPLPGETFADWLGRLSDDELQVLEDELKVLYRHSGM